MNKPFDPTKPVQTRDGHKARIICTDAKGPQPIVALIKTNSGMEFESRHSQCGSYFDDGNTSGSDLINITETKTVELWVNVYSREIVLWHSKDNAIKNATDGIFARLHIKQEVKEGEGL